MKPDTAAASPLAPGEPRIDIEKLVQLRDLLGDAFAPLVASFIANSALYVTQIETAIAQSDLTQAVAVAHKLKSSAAQLGLPDLARAAERVEKLEPAQHLGALKTIQAELCAALHEKAQALSRGDLLQ